MCTFVSVTARALLTISNFRSIRVCVDGGFNLRQTRQPEFQFLDVTSSCGGDSVPAALGDDTLTTQHGDNDLASQYYTPALPRPQAQPSQPQLQAQVQPVQSQLQAQPLPAQQPQPVYLIIDGQASFYPALSSTSIAAASSTYVTRPVPASSQYMAQAVPASGTYIAHPVPAAAMMPTPTPQSMVLPPGLMPSHAPAPLAQPAFIATGQPGIIPSHVQAGPAELIHSGASVAQAGLIAGPTPGLISGSPVPVSAQPHSLLASAVIVPSAALMQAGPPTSILPPAAAAAASGTNVPLTTMQQNHNVPAQQAVAVSPHTVPAEQAVPANLQTEPRPAASVNVCSLLGPPLVAAPTTAVTDVNGSALATIPVHVADSVSRCMVADDCHDAVGSLRGGDVSGMVAVSRNVNNSSAALAVGTSDKHRDPSTSESLAEAVGRLSIDGEDVVSMECGNGFVMECEHGMMSVQSPARLTAAAPAETNNFSGLGKHKSCSVDLFRNMRIEEV